MTPMHNGKPDGAESLAIPVAEILGRYLDTLQLEGVDLLHAKMAVLAAEALDDDSTPRHLRPHLMATLRQSLRDLNARTKKTGTPSAEARALLSAVTS
jgi:hypothetical protein